MSKANSDTSNGESAVVTEEIAEKRVGCAHYKRRAKFVVS